jgi:hypothetical protein
MPNSAQQSSSLTPNASAAKSTAPTPLRCFTGAIIAAPLAFALYRLTLVIVHSFANKPLPSQNELATKLAILVRTLVIGMSALGMGIFAIAALGLFALGIQLLLKRDAATPEEPQN